ncbi:hypothetical protein ACIQK5_36470 [Streptomyces virginiae]|uniref:hypothetical protein n=1 Tax=Streptomyces TaxID=1883 RepID=UPI00136F83CB|nr:hypothetical protein [Streptomyces sp. SID1046]MYV73280.1 hypothetical protein [Streptomyces sp. SID1046]
MRAQLDHTPGTPYASLAGPSEVVQDRQSRLTHASAVDAFAASGHDDSGTIDMTELWRRR